MNRSGHVSPTLRMVAGLVIGLLLGASPALVGAAEKTDVIDAFDKDDPFDFNLGLSFIHELHRAKIVREGSICRERDVGGNCVDWRLTTFNDARWERVTNAIKISPRVGLAPDFNLIVDIPVIFGDVRRLTANSLNGCAGGTCVPVSPTTLERDGLLNNITTGGTGLITGGPRGRAEKSRSGIGDMFIGLELGLLNQDRDPSKSFWTIGIGSTIPSGKVMRVDNNGVGRGVFGLTAWTSFSRRFRYLEPYAGIRAMAEIPAKNSLIEETHFPHSGQRTWLPGILGEINGGFEIVPYEDKKKDIKFAIDLGFVVRYVSEGRDYTALSDFIGETDNCDNLTLAGPVVVGRDLYDGSTYTRRDPTLCNSGDDPTVMNPLPAPNPFGGLTDAEQHMEYVGKFGLVVHATKWAMFSLTFSFQHIQEHFLTFGDAGVDSADPGGVVNTCDPSAWDGGAGGEYFHDDTNGNGVVDPGENVTEAYECNPNFQPVFDLPGRRIRMEENSLFTTMFTATIRF